MEPITNTVETPLAIDRMRSRSEETDWASSFNEDEILQVIALLSKVTSKSDIAEQLDKEPAYVEKMVKTLGTWIAHTSKGKKVPDFKFEYVSTDSDLQLFETGNRKGIRTKKGVGTIVAIPLGFDKASGAKSQCEQSIARLLFDTPTAEQLTRFLARVQSVNATPVISGRDIYALWEFDSIGRIEEIDQVSDSKTFAQRFVLAWDVMSAKLETTAFAVEVINTFPEEGGNHELLCDAIDTAMWASQAHLTRLAATIGSFDPANAASVRAFTAELRLVQKRIESKPTEFAPTQLWNMNQGQVLRLVEALGLAERENQRATELQMRDQLVEMGLNKDLDLLLPIGVEAERVDCLDDFWVSVEEFQAGNPNWREVLLEAVADTVAA